MTAASPDRGWWHRLWANTADVSPWDEKFLSRLKVEQEAIRHRTRTRLRPQRRREARKAGDVS